MAKEYLKKYLQQIQKEHPDAYEKAKKVSIRSWLHAKKLYETSSNRQKAIATGAFVGILFVSCSVMRSTGGGGCNYRNASKEYEASELVSLYSKNPISFDENLKGTCVSVIGRPSEVSSTLGYSIDLGDGMTVNARISEEVAKQLTDGSYPQYESAINGRRDLIRLTGIVGGGMEGMFVSLGSAKPDREWNYTEYKNAENSRRFLRAMADAKNSVKDNIKKREQNKTDRNASIDPDFFCRQLKDLTPDEIARNGGDTYEKCVNRTRKSQSDEMNKLNARTDLYIDVQKKVLNDLQSTNYTFEKDCKDSDEGVIYQAWLNCKDRILKELNNKHGKGVDQQIKNMDFSEMLDKVKGKYSRKIGELNQQKSRDCGSFNEGGSGYSSPASKRSELLQECEADKKNISVAIKEQQTILDNLQNKTIKDCRQDELVGKCISRFEKFATYDSNQRFKTEKNATYFYNYISSLADKYAKSAAKYTGSPTGEMYKAMVRKLKSLRYPEDCLALKDKYYRQDADSCSSYFRGDDFKDDIKRQLGMPI